MHVSAAVCFCSIFSAQDAERTHSHAFFQPYGSSGELILFHFRFTSFPIALATPNEVLLHNPFDRYSVASTARANFHVESTCKCSSSSQQQQRRWRRRRQWPQREIIIIIDCTHLSRDFITLTSQQQQRKPIFLSFFSLSVPRLIKITLRQWSDPQKAKTFVGVTKLNFWVAV